jgi:hypothetical protein
MATRTLEKAGHDPSPPFTEFHIMSIRNPARLMALISFSLMPSHLSAAAAEGEWSSEKPW